MRVILASKSPRRRELLKGLFSDFEIITRDTDETTPSDMHPRESVEVLAVRKGAAVLSRETENALIIASDTLVELDGSPLGKPADEADAVSMLMRLSGKRHNVHTGVSVHYGGRVFSGVDTSSVIFRSFSESEALDYVKTGEPMDKAGAYAIQGIGAALVEKYEGSFDTIVGLSMSLTERLVNLAVENDKG